jgi:hypothetical protein
MDEQLVQPIAVLKNSGSHEEVVQAVAEASVLAWLNAPEDPAWEAWLSGRFTKSVRRATPAQISAATEFALADVGVNEAQALGFAPMTYAEYPKVLSKMQVANTDFERTGRWIVDPYAEGPKLWLNVENEMTTGKTAAQVAHGLFAWLLRKSEEERRAWQGNGMPLSIAEVPASYFAKMRFVSVVTVNDAGFTEVDPHTTTVVVTE